MLGKVHVKVTPLLEVVVPVGACPKLTKLMFEGSTSVMTGFVKLLPVTVTGKVSVTTNPVALLPVTVTARV